MNVTDYAFTQHDNQLPAVFQRLLSMKIQTHNVRNKDFFRWYTQAGSLSPITTVQRVQCTLRGRQLSGADRWSTCGFRYHQSYPSVFSTHLTTTAYAETSSVQLHTVWRLSSTALVLALIRMHTSKQWRGCHSRDLQIYLRVNKYHSSKQCIRQFGNVLQLCYLYGVSVMCMNFSELTCVVYEHFMTSTMWFFVYWVHYCVVEVSVVVFVCLPVCLDLCCILSSWRINVYTLCSKKSDAKIEITITTTHLIRIKYPLSSFNYHLFGANVANFNKIHCTVFEQQLFKNWNSKTEVSNMEKSP